MFHDVSVFNLVQKTKTFSSYSSFNEVLKRILEKKKAANLINKKEKRKAD